MAEEKLLFKDSLRRTFKQIRDAAAESVTEDMETTYKRKIEDLALQIRRYDRDRDDLILSLAPNNALSTTVVPSDFSAEKFLEKDLEIGRNKRDTLIYLRLMLNRYNDLFGEYAEAKKVETILTENGF